ncbi:MAG TPA: 3-methyl-2-oxobutanoate dehydrogenase subunit VorB [Thermoflexia bacterium]|jgi:2-oxoglutarate ferredoxin oxidoreductase subunit alpha|nr:3-methyl-2-oxobutanoate dehydrogenase subunit VorB [Thermoflexia bacterium]
MAKELWEGNAAIAEAAIRAGVEAFFGYPITPQTEVLEHFSKRLPELGRVFLQAESEVASINMVYGAACAGARVMTSSSSPGISLMQEGLSYIACSEVPVVVINIMRGGPGLGNVQPSQGDYFQAVKMAGHGDFHPIVLAPANVQEAIDYVVLAFDLAEKYRTIAMVVADGAIGQMMEPAEMPPMRPVRPPEERPDWALTGAQGREPNIITSLYLGAENLERVNLRLQAKLKEIAANEVRWKEYSTEDADLLLVAFGTVGRVCQTVVREARKAGMKVGLLRPVTLWPFPSGRIAELAEQVRGVLTVEMNAGQMVEDVRLAVEGRCPVRFYGRMGGVIPLPDEILPELEKLDKEC